MFYSVVQRLVFMVVLALFLTSANAQQLSILTHDSFTISEDVLDAFTEDTGIELRFIQGGDAGETTNKAILTRRRPLADLFFGIDNSLIARATDKNIFEPYASPALGNVPESLQFDPDNNVTPVDAGYVNFNLDKVWFEENSVSLPSNLDELATEDYKGLTVVENPNSSSPGLAFMLTTIDNYGDGWLTFWQALRDNDLQVTDGWTDAYYSAFTRYGGDRPVVLSYASSPAAEVIFSEEPLDEAPTVNLFCDKCAYEQIEAVGILKGADNVEAAQQFIDYMLSVQFQEDIPMNMFVYPVNSEASIPAEFEAYSQVPEANVIANVESSVIEANLETWLDQWTQVVLQGKDADKVK